MTYFEMLLAQSVDSRAKRFAWQPDQKLALGDAKPPEPEWLNKARERTEKGWPDKYRGFGSNVLPKKAR